MSMSLHRLGDAGVVDQHVDPAELLTTCSTAATQAALSVTSQAIAAMRVAEFDCGGRGLRRVEIENDRPAAVQREQLGGGPADAALRGRPGNNADLVSEKHCRLLNMLSLVGACSFSSPQCSVFLTLKTVFSPRPYRRNTYRLATNAQTNNKRYR